MPKIENQLFLTSSKSWIHGGGNRIEPGSSSSAHEDGNRIATGWMHGRLHSIDSRFSFSLFDGSSNDASNVFEDRRTHPPNLGRGNGSRERQICFSNLSTEEKIFVEIFFVREVSPSWFLPLLSFKKERINRVRIVCYSECFCSSFLFGIQCQKLHKMLLFRQNVLNDQ